MRIWVSRAPLRALTAALRARASFAHATPQPALTGSRASLSRSRTAPLARRARVGSGALSGLGNAVAGATLAEYSDGEEEARAPRLEDPARHPAFTVFDVGRSGVNRVHPEADEASRGAMSAKIRFRLLEGVDIGAFDKTTSRRDDDRRESSRSPRAPRPAPRRARDARPDGRGARVRASGRTRGSRARARRRAPVPSRRATPPRPRARPSRPSSASSAGPVAILRVSRARNDARTRAHQEAIIARASLGFFSPFVCSFVSSALSPRRLTLPSPPTPTNPPPPSGPIEFPLGTPIAAVKERAVAEWPEPSPSFKAEPPADLASVKLILNGKVLEHGKSLKQAKVPTDTLVTCHLMVQAKPPKTKPGAGAGKGDGETQKCGCVVQ